MLRLSCLFAALLLTVRAAETPTQDFGQIKIARVIGAVSLVADDTGEETPLYNGDLVYEGYTIVTGTDSSVVLVFSNGATVRLLPNTRLAVETFRQDPLAGDVDAGSITAEPTASNTSLNVVYGEVVGDIHKLNKSTSYSIKSANGSAGIRGTQFRYVDRELADGSHQFAVNTTEGVVRVADPAGHQPIDVAAGQEVAFHPRAGAGVPWARARAHAINARIQRLVEHNGTVIRATRKAVRFRAADGKAGPGRRPQIKRDSKREKEKENDLKDFAKDNPEWKHAPAPRTPRRKGG